MASTYSDYAFYKNTFCGELAESDYTRSAIEAKSVIDLQTFKRASTAPAEMLDAVKLCECALVDAIYAYSKVPHGVTSVNNDGYSASFTEKDKEPAALRSICKKYLTFPVNLMFGGAVSVY